MSHFYFKNGIAIAFSFCLLFAQTAVNAQEEVFELDSTIVVQVMDSTIVDSNTVAIPSKIIRYNPGRAAWKSALVPGWGQWYNHQRTKAPVFFTGIATGIGFAISEHGKFKSYDNAYRALLLDPNAVTDYPNLTRAQIQAKSLDHKGNKGLATNLALVVYGFNILDAYASANILNSKRNHIPAKSAYLSAILPGMGQIYNDQWWKVPFVYAALGTGVYMIRKNYSRYDSFREAYIFRDDPDYIPDAIVDTTLADSELLRIIDYYRSNLDLAVLLTSAMYILNVIDATVFGHLHEFDVDSELSWRLSPEIRMQQLSNRQEIIAGLHFNYRF